MVGNVGRERDKNPMCTFMILFARLTKGAKYSDFRVVMQILEGKKEAGNRTPLFPLREYDCRFNGASGDSKGWKGGKRSLV